MCYCFLCKRFDASVPRFETCVNKIVNKITTISTASEMVTFLINIFNQLLSHLDTSAILFETLWFPLGPFPCTPPFCSVFWW